MKYKCIYLPSFADEDKKNTAIVNSYVQHFMNEQRAKISAQIWKKIKTKNKELIVTLDTIFVILNDGCLIDREFIEFLKIIQGNSQLTLAILAVLQDESELIWPTLDLLKFINESDAKRLIEEVTLERKKAIAALKDWFYKKSHYFKPTQDYCPSLINKLNDQYLRELVLNNTASVALLINENFASRLSKMVNEKDLVKLFMVEVKPSQKQGYILILLDYCSIYHPGILSIIFQLLQDDESTPLIQNPKEILDRILSCKKELLLFFERNPGLFLSFTLNLIRLFEILKFTEDPVGFLSRMVKTAQVATRIASNLLLLIEALLEKNQPERSKQVAQFLLNHASKPINGKSESYSRILSVAVKKILNDISNASVKEFNAVLVILNDIEIRKIVNFNNDELLELLQKKSTRPIIEQIILQDDRLWDLFKPSLKHLFSRSNTFLREDYPYIYSRLNLDNKIKQTNIDSLSAYLIANGERWLEMKKNSLEQKIIQQNHPIFLLRIAHEENKPAKYFTEILVNYLMSDDGLLLMNQDQFCLDLFCSLASGKNYIELFQKIDTTLLDIQEHKNLSRKSQYIVQVKNHYIKKILSNYYYVKAACAINRKNIIFMVDLLREEKLSNCIDGRELLAGLVELNDTNQLEFLQKISSNHSLILQLFIQTKGDPLSCQQLLKLFNKPEIIEILFGNLEDKQLLNIINNSSVKITQFLLTATPNLTIARVVAKIRTFFHLIENTEVIKYYLQNPGYVKELAMRMSCQNFIDLLQAKTFCENRECVIEIIRQRHFFPFKQLKNQRTNLLVLIAKNKFFAECIFTQWELFSEIRLPPEILVQLFLEENYDVTTSYLLENREAYIYFVIQNIFDILSRNIQQLLTDKLTISRQPAITNEKNFVETKFKLKDLGGDLELVMHKNMPHFTDNFPIKLLLDNGFYNNLLSMITIETYHNIHVFLQKLPENYLQLQQLFNLNDDVEQLAFVKIIFRIKQLVTSLIIYYHRELKESCEEMMVDKFLQALSIAAINFPNDLLNSLSEKSFFTTVVACWSFQSAAKKIICVNKGEMLLRFLLLKASFELKEITQEVKESLIYELYIQPIKLSEEDINYIVKLFPITFLIAAKHPQLSGYFLRQPLYVEKFSYKGLLNLIGNSSELIKCALIYRHLYLKFPDSIIKGLIERSRLSKSSLTKEIAIHLATYALTKSITFEHPLFVGETKTSQFETEARHSTSRFFSPLDPAQNKNQTESFAQNEINANKFIKGICGSQYLTIEEKRFNDLIQKLTETTFFRSKFDLALNLVMLVTEPVIAIYFKNKSEKTIITMSDDKNTIEIWRANFQLDEANSQLKELLQKELLLNVDHQDENNELVPNSIANKRR